MSESLKGLLVRSLIVCALFIAVPGSWFLAESAWTVRQARPHLVQTLTDTNRAVIAIGAAAGNVEKASRAWEKSSEAQSQSFSKAMSNVNAVAIQATTSLASLEKNLNSFLQASNQAIGQQNVGLLDVESQAQQTFSKLGTTADALTSATEAIDRRVSDPNIDVVTANLAATTAHASEATKNLNGMAQDGRDVADYYKRQLTRPVGFWRTVVSFILNNTYKARQGFAPHP